MVSAVGPWQGGISLGRLAEIAEERTGGAEELVFEGRVESATVRYARARRFSAGIRAAGLRGGDRVVVHMANCPEVESAYHGVWRAGGVVTPVLFLLAEAELRQVIVDSGARFVVTTPDLLARTCAAAHACPDLRAVIVTSDEGPPDHPALPDRVTVTDHADARLADGLTADGLADGLAADGLAADGLAADKVAAGHMAADDVAAGGPVVLRFDELAGGEEGTLASVGPQDMAALLYTGGTTGRARGVVLSHDAMSAGGYAALSGAEDEGLVGLLPLPLSHVYGLTISVMTLHVRKPGPAVLMRWFDPRAWLALVTEHRVNVSALVPSMIAQLLAEPLHLHDTSSLRRLISGGAPLPRETALEWGRRLPGVELVEGYGCTESAGVIAASPPSGAPLGSVGQAAGGVEVRVELPDGAPAHPGQDGEICVRGPMLMTGYWHDQAGSEHALRGGWLHTGDVGRLDRDGYLYVIDRMKDLIIRGGVNVYPRDVEDGLLGHPDVAACGVVGRPCPRHGEEVVAFVQRSPGGTAGADELVRWSRARLGPLRYPREVHLVESLPVTSTLKIDRRALRALLATRSATG